MQQVNGKSQGELSPSLLARIENLHLRAQKAARGALAGVHRSVHHGSSIEFSEHKVYVPGDDIRHIDWRVYAKSDRLHIKQFEDETNLRVMVMVDCSGSMGFSGSDRPAKLELSRTIAGAFAYLALRQGDGIGLQAFSSSHIRLVPIRSAGSHLLEFLHQLAKLEPNGETEIARAVDSVTEREKKRSLVFVLSDLFDRTRAGLDALARMAACGHEVVVMHLLDPCELDFDYETPATFASMETDERLFVHPRLLRRTFTDEMAAFVESTRTRLRSHGIDYRLIRTDTPAADTIAHLLHSRAMV